MRASSFLKSLITCSLALLCYATAAAQEFIDLGGGESDGIPPIVKHLPDWERVRESATYAVKLPVLQRAVPGEPVLEVVPFVGGTEAVAADYGAAGRVVIVEYSTPQLAADADARVNARINELRAAQQSVPTVYQRKGNYSVFVFGASDEAAARELADRVHYEKDVRWLGDNPHINERIERANRLWLNMSASVLLNSVKAAGYAIALCFGVGGLLGAFVFRRRRAEANLSARYSDAGGMMRLNLDENTRKMLGQGEK